jgi:hypothetical protein
MSTDDQINMIDIPIPANGFDGCVVDPIDPKRFESGCRNYVKEYNEFLVREGCLAGAPFPLFWRAWFVVRDFVMWPLRKRGEG